MALSTRIQATCLLLLLLASLSSGAYLRQQVSTPSPLWWESQVPGKQGFLSTEYLGGLSRDGSCWQDKGGPQWKG